MASSEVRWDRVLRLLAVATATATAIALVFVGSHVMRPWPDALWGTDFVAYWAGGVMVKDGAGSALYDMERQHALQIQWRLESATADSIRLARGFSPYLNPPATAVLFYPLAMMPLPWAFPLFQALSALAFLAVVPLALRGTPKARPVALLLLAAPPVADTLVSGRMEAALLLAFWLGLLALRGDRPVLGGALIGLLWLKPQYAGVYTLVLLMKRRWQELAGMVATLLVMLVLSLAVVGLEGIVRYVEVLGRIGGLQSPLAAGTLPPIMVNWRALLLKPFFGLEEGLGSVLVLLLAAATVLISLPVWRGRWDPKSPCFGLQWMVATMATLAGGPHAHYQGAVFLLVPLAIVVARPPQAVPLRGAWWPLLAVGWSLALFVWLFLDWRWLMAPYFLVAMGLLTYQVLAHRPGLGEAGQTAARPAETRPAVAAQGPV